MQIRLSLTSDYSDREKGVEMPDVEISKEFEGTVPTAEQLDSLIALFRRCIVEDTADKPKTRELGISV